MFSRSMATSLVRSLAREPRDDGHARGRPIGFQVKTAVPCDRNCAFEVERRVARGSTKRDRCRLGVARDDGHRRVPHRRVVHHELAVGGRALERCFKKGPVGGAERESNARARVERAQLQAFPGRDVVQVRGDGGPVGFLERGARERLAGALLPEIGEEVRHRRPFQPPPRRALKVMDCPKHMRMRGRRLTNFNPNPEGVREPVCIPKKCFIWTRWYS